MVEPQKNNTTIYVILGVVILSVIGILVYFLILKKEQTQPVSQNEALSPVDAPVPSGIPSGPVDAPVPSGVPSGPVDAPVPSGVPSGPVGAPVPSGVTSGPVSAPVPSVNVAPIGPSYFNRDYILNTASETFGKQNRFRIQILPDTSAAADGRTHGISVGRPVKYVGIPPRTPAYSLIKIESNLFFITSDKGFFNFHGYFIDEATGTRQTGIYPTSKTVSSIEFGTRQSTPSIPTTISDLAILGLGPENVTIRCSISTVGGLSPTPTPSTTPSTSGTCRVVVTRISDGVICFDSSAVGITQISTVTGFAAIVSTLLNVPGVYTVAVSVGVETLRTTFIVNFPKPVLTSSTTGTATLTLSQMYPLYDPFDVSNVNFFYEDTCNLKLVDNSRDNEKFISSVSIDDLRTGYTLTGLTTGSQYHVQILYSNNKVSSDTSNPITI